MTGPSYTKKYFRLNYGTKQRFVSYWHQVSEILSICPQGGRVLEIGVGSGLVHWYLENCGLDITTLDITLQLQPQVCGDVTRIPFRDNAFDLVAAFEILEHIPYEKTLIALSELQRVTRQHVVISVPDHTRVFRFMATIPKVGIVRSSIEVPLAVGKYPRGDEHEWEIGVKGYTAKRLERDISAAGFNIMRNYRPYEHPSHRFFTLKKANHEKWAAVE